MTSKTEAILRVIVEELAARQPEIDGDPGLRAVSVTVSLHESGQPRQVIYRPDSARPLTKAPAGA